MSCETLCVPASSSTMTMPGAKYVLLDDSSGMVVTQPGSGFLFEVLFHSGVLWAGDLG